MANTSVVSIEYPEELIVSLKYRKNEFAEEMKKMSLVKLFELGRVSTGMAAKALNMNRIDFIQLLGSYKVSIFPYQSQEELLEDVTNA